MATPTARTVPGAERSWRLPRILLEDQLVLAALCWAGFVTFAMATVTVVSFFRDIETSAWGIATGIIPWYSAFIGGYVLHTVLPVHIAHGRTRRDTAIESLIFCGVFTPFVALLATLGFGVEQGVYAIAGWTRGTPDDRLFSAYTDYGTIFVESWLTVLVWTSAGALVGAAFYRDKAAGWLALIPAAIMVSLVGISSGPQFMGFILDRLPSIDPSSLWVLAPMAMACCLAALAMTWPIVRDVPLRNR